MTTRHITTLGLTALAAGVLAACSGSGSSTGSAGSPDGSSTGTLSIGLMDMPVFDAEEVWICITQINVKPEEGDALEFPLENADEETACDGEPFDLLTLQGPENAEFLIQNEEVDAGPYEWIELELDAARPGNSSDADGDLDSYVVDSTGAQHVLRVPSGSVRLVSGFTVTAGQHTQFTLDWDLRGGLTNPVGMDGYLLRPAFRIIDETSFGTLTGTVAGNVITDATGDAACDADDPDLDVGNVVYLFALDDPETELEPDDTDTDDGEGEHDADATVEVRPNAEDSDYSFGTILAPGHYRVAFTCQGDSDLPDRNENDAENPDDDIPDIVFLDPDGDENITITEGETTTVSFSSLP